MYIVAVLHAMSNLQEILGGLPGRLWTKAYMNTLYEVRVVHMNPIKHVQKCSNPLLFLYVQMIFPSILPRLLPSPVVNKHLFHTKVLT